MPPDHTYTEVLQIIAGGGSTALLVWMTWLSKSGELLWRTHHDAIVTDRDKQLAEKTKEIEWLKADRDTWIQRTLRLTNVAGSAIEATKAVAQRVEG